MHHSLRPIVLALSATISFTSVGTAADWFVAAGASGSGTSASPFGRIQDGIAAAQPGDRVVVRPGTYTGRLASVRAGTASAPITVRSEKGRGSVIVTAPGELLEVNHAYFVVEGLVFDGQYGDGDGLDVNAASTGFTLRSSEVRRTRRDCVDISSVRDATIEGSLIHHCLNSANGRTDAHGIVAGAVRNLVIRDTEIHTFSGDGFQVDPSRSSAGWGGVMVERVKIWLAPLPAAVAGFAAGTVTGENGIDTKSGGTAPRATMTVRDSTFSGFRNGLVSNMAALNLKENVDVTVDRVTIHASNIGFRTRGAASYPSAWVTIKNAVLFDLSYGIRYENNIERLRLYNATFGAGVTRPFYAASSSMTGLDVRNTLITASALPQEASASSNRAVTTGVFVDGGADDYHLLPGAAPVNHGLSVAGVATDRDGIGRPQEGAFDIGAYEHQGNVVAGTASDVVIHVTRSASLAGAWRKVTDATAAGGSRLHHPDAGVAAVSTRATPTNYVEVTFNAVPGVPYRVWFRARAERDSIYNDSGWVQFDNTLNDSGAAAWRIGTTGSLFLSLQDCSSCVLAGWGWQDLSRAVTFATGGLQRLRLQTREDGLSIDQVVLSPGTWLTARPGPATQDTTILAPTQ